MALDEDNIKEAMVMATTDEQRERAKKAAAYIEQVGRTYKYLIVVGPHMQLSNKHMHILICLQVKRTQKSLTDPKNKPKINFWATPRSKAAATAAQAYSSQVSRQLRLANIGKAYTVTTYIHSPFQLKIARSIVMDLKNNNDKAEAQMTAAAADAADAAKTNRSSGFLPPGSRSSSMPKGTTHKIDKNSPVFKPGPPALNLDLRPQKPATQTSNTGTTPGAQVNSDVNVPSPELPTDPGNLLPLGLSDKPALAVVQDVIQVLNK